MSEITGIGASCSVERSGQSQYEISYQPTINSPVILSQKRVNLGLIAREGFSNVSCIKKCALQHTKSLKESD